MDKEFHCPRCQNSNIIEYSDSIECPICKLEFYKKDLIKYKDNQILAIQEKSDFIKFVKD